MRVALAGTLWYNKFTASTSTKGWESSAVPPAAAAEAPDVREPPGTTCYNDDVISMPDKWEYPWYAAWDLAFHCVPLTHGRSRVRQEQLELMLRERVPAPERADPGLRVELRRREPAGARLGDAASSTSSRQARARQGRPRFLRARSTSC